MAFSMTGYGKAEIALKQGKLLIEIQSVNRRFLEIANYLPKEFTSLDMDIRKEIKKYCSRGLVNVRVQLLETKPEIAYDMKVMKNCHRKLCAMAGSLGYPKESISFAFLLEQCKMGTIWKNEEKTKMLKGLKLAIIDWMKMKKTEGKTLMADIQKRVIAIEKWTKEIQKLAKGQIPKKKKEMTDRFSSCFQADSDCSQRVMQEIVIYLEKMDITEEITRLFSHFSQIKGLFPAEKGAGKKMEFIVQEMLREVNTIAAKSSDCVISQKVIDIKAELEKIKEQVQNIE